MAKQSIFGRISQLLRANINALIDQAEDPQLMLDQMVRDFTNSIADAEAAIAETIGNLRLLEDDHREDVEAAREWGEKALAASRKGDELRAAGDAAGRRQVRQPREGRPQSPDLRRERGEGGGAADRRADRGGRQAQERAERHEGEARPAAEQAVRAGRARQDRPGAAQVQDAVKSIDILDPTSEIGRFEDKIRREEAVVRGQAELAASSLDAQFNELDDLGELTEVDARLAELKAGGSSRGAISG
jgi:phage shock protein A